MTTNDKPGSYPPLAEARRQQSVHSWRVLRRKCAQALVEHDFVDSKSLHSLQDINSKIELLKAMREPYADLSPEPSLDEIKAREDSWYWEPWEGEDSDDER